MWQTLKVPFGLRDGMTDEFIRKHATARPAVPSAAMKKLAYMRLNKEIKAGTFAEVPPGEQLVSRIRMVAVPKYRGNVLRTDDCRIIGNMRPLNALATKSTALPTSSVLSKSPVTHVLVQITKGECRYGLGPGRLATCRCIWTMTSFCRPVYSVCSARPLWG